MNKEYSVYRVRMENGTMMYFKKLIDAKYWAGLDSRRVVLKGKVQRTHEEVLGIA